MTTCRRGPPPNGTGRDGTDKTPRIFFTRQNKKSNFHVVADRSALIFSNFLIIFFCGQAIFLFHARRHLFFPPSPKRAVYPFIYTLITHVLTLARSQHSNRERTSTLTPFETCNYFCVSFSPRFVDIIVFRENRNDVYRSSFERRK